jgi:hypothetical protein
MKTLCYVLLLGLWTALAQAAPETAAPPAPASAAENAPADADAEQEIVAQLRASPAAADAQELTVDGKPVLALWRSETTGRPLGGVILLHDVDAHADWPGVVGPLRRDLPQHGWNTLSLQLAAAEQTPARLRAALAFLAGKGGGDIVLLGHGDGARAALRYAADNPGAVNGLVLVAMGGAEDDALLEPVGIPIYDIYGSADGLEVHIAGARRLLAGRRFTRRDSVTPSRYRQFVVEAADHLFSQQGDILQRRVQGWLKTYRGRMETTVP